MKMCWTLSKLCLLLLVPFFRTRFIYIEELEVLGRLIGFRSIQSAKLTPPSLYRIVRPISAPVSTVCIYAILFCCRRCPVASDWYCSSSGLANGDEYSNPQELSMLTRLATEDDCGYISTCTPGSPCMPRDDVSVRRYLLDVSQPCKACSRLTVHKYS